MDNWKYVKKDGNPDREGYYHVVLVFDEVKDFKRTGRELASIETRLFCDASRYPDWIMDDQPEEGLVWTLEQGSHTDEHVLAWWAEDEKPEPILPDGVIWKEK